MAVRGRELAEAEQILRSLPDHVRKRMLNVIREYAADLLEPIPPQSGASEELQLGVVDEESSSIRQPRHTPLQGVCRRRNKATAK